MITLFISTGLFLTIIATIELSKLQSNDERYRLIAFLLCIGCSLLVTGIRFFASDFSVDLAKAIGGAA